MDDRGKLYPRCIRANIEAALADTPVVCLLGPRQCGKTTLVRSFEPKRTYVSLDEEALLATARDDPSGFVAALQGPVILDEVQRAPALLQALKIAVDRDRQPGRFLLTGSANLLLLSQVSESLAGRMEIVHLHPLTEAEKERRPGAFLSAFLTGKLRARVNAEAEISAVSLPSRILAGGYPEPLLRPAERARQWRRQYLQTLIGRDVQDIARIREPEAVARFLELLSHRTAELLNTSGLASDIGINRETVERYLAILERLFLIRRLPAWHRNEARRLVKAPKIHLVDSGLAAALSGLQEVDWLERRDQFGHLLESFVIQQIIAQAGWTDSDLRFWHYRDKDQVEADLVITRGRQVWGIEVKASTTVNPADGRGLRRLADQSGKDFQGGILIYAGTSSLALGDARLLAVPLSLLWGM